MRNTHGYNITCILGIYALLEIAFRKVHLNERQELNTGFHPESRDRQCAAHFFKIAALCRNPLFGNCFSDRFINYRSVYIVVSYECRNQKYKSTKQIFRNFAKTHTQEFCYDINFLFKNILFYFWHIFLKYFLKNLFFTEYETYIIDHAKL